MVATVPVPLTDDLLADRARQLEDVLESLFYTPSGIMYSFLDQRSGRPFTKDEVSHLPARFEGGPPPADYLAYENSPMVMGAYLSALVSREKVAPDSTGRERITRVFSGIRKLAQAGRERREEGWLPKPYDGIASLESSNDQYGEVIAGLWALAHLKTHPDSAQAADLLVKLADFWIRHDYRCPYHGRPDHRWMGKSQWGLVCLGFVRMAWMISGKPRYREESERLCRVEKCDHPETRKGNIVPYPGRPGIMIRRLSAYHHLVVRMLDILVDAWPERVSHWHRLLERFWSDDVRPGIADDGLLFANYQIDTVKNTWKPLSDAPLTEAGIAKGAGRLKSGALSCFTAVSNEISGRRLPNHEEECRMLVTRTLEAVGKEQMTFLFGHNGMSDTSDLSIKANMLDGRALAQWLLAYWNRRNNDSRHTP